MDVLSRKCHLRVLKGKTSATVAAALRSVFEESGVSPAYVISDRFLSPPSPQSARCSRLPSFRGTEFAGAPFRDLLSRYSIHHYYANPPYKASMAYAGSHRGGSRSLAPLGRWPFFAGNG